MANFRLSQKEFIAPLVGIAAKTLGKGAIKGAFGAAKIAGKTAMKVGGAAINTVGAVGSAVSSGLFNKQKEQPTTLNTPAPQLNNAQNNTTASTTNPLLNQQKTFASKGTFKKGGGGVTIPNVTLGNKTSATQQKQKTTPTTTTNAVTQQKQKTTPTTTTNAVTPAPTTTTNAVTPAPTTTPKTPNTAQSQDATTNKLSGWDKFNSVTGAIGQGSMLLGTLGQFSSNKLMKEQNRIQASQGAQQIKLEQAKQQADARLAQEELDLKKKLVSQGKNPFVGSDASANMIDTNAAPQQPYVPTIYQKAASEGTKRQKSYSIFSFTRDMSILASRNRGKLAGGVVAGAAATAGLYAADRAIRKHKERTEKSHDIDSSDSDSSGRRDQKEYSNKTISLKLPVFSFALGALTPVLTYASEKKLQKDMENETTRRPVKYKEEEKGFSNLSSGQKVVDAVSRMAGGGGYAGMRRLGFQISAIGKKSGNKATKKLGKAIVNNPNAAAVLSIPAGVALLSGTYAVGEKIVSDIVKKKDKDAFGYMNSKEEKID